jgi:hypothetical protein
MSTRTTFFVATAGEALTMELPAELVDMPKVESKNITPDMVGDLDFLLTGNREREPVCLRDDDILVVFRLDNEVSVRPTASSFWRPDSSSWGLSNLGGEPWPITSGMRSGKRFGVECSSVLRRAG